MLRLSDETRNRLLDAIVTGAPDQICFKTDELAAEDWWSDIPMSDGSTLRVTASLLRAKVADRTARVKPASHGRVLVEWETDTGLCYMFVITCGD